MAIESRKFVFGQDCEPEWFKDFTNKIIVKTGCFSTLYIYNPSDYSQCRRFVDCNVVKYEDLYEW